MNDSAWRPGDPDRKLPGEELRDRTSAADLALLTAVPVVLIAVYLWPGAPEEVLVLSHADPALVAAVTTHFVHRSSGHLLANLVAYGLVVPTAYGLAVLADGRRAFFGGFAALLVAAPPLLTAFDLAAFDRGVVFGFSGVAMALVGFLPVVVGAFAEGRFDLARRRHVGPALFFAGLGLVALLAIQPLAARIAVAAVALSAAGILLRRGLGVGRLPRRLPPGVHRSDVEFLGVAVLVFATALLMGFTGGRTAGGAIVHTFGHLLGYVLGFLVPFAGVIRGGSLEELRQGGIV